MLGELPFSAAVSHSGEPQGHIHPQESSLWRDIWNKLVSEHSLTYRQFLPLLLWMLQA